MTAERFWLERNSLWPSDWPDYVFLLSAFQQVGAAVWKDEWTGHEGLCVARGLPALYDFQRSARRKNPDMPPEEAANLGEAEYEKAVALVRAHLARAEKVRRMIAIACVSGAVPSFTHVPSNGQMYALRLDHWRTDNLKPRFLVGQIDTSDISSSAISGRGFAYVFLGEGPFQAWLAREVAKATPPRPAPPGAVDTVAPAADQAPAPEPAPEETPTAEQPVRGVKAETMATNLLARLLRQNKHMTRDEARAAIPPNYEISGEGFQHRVWPDARAEAGLDRVAPKGRKPRREAAE